MQPRARPTGVTILAILNILGGMFSFGIGLLLLVIGSPATVPLAAGLLLVASSLIDFVLAWGYLGGNGWAWILGIIFGVINIVGTIVEVILGVSSSNILSAIFSLITIGYLTRPSIKAFFGRPGPFQPSQLNVLPMAAGQTLRASSEPRPCRSCGEPVPPGAGFCRNCGQIQ